MIWCKIAFSYIENIKIAINFQKRKGKVGGMENAAITLPKIGFYTSEKYS